MRTFTRHPANVPIEIALHPVASEDDYATVDAEFDEFGEPAAPSTVETTPPGENTLRNISAGGLCFSMLHPVETGTGLTISMPQVWPDYFARGEVVWCARTAEGFDVGVRFCEDNEAFKARMVAQFCQIEEYRSEQFEHHGRELSSEEAAQEWIVQYAEQFAADFMEPQSSTDQADTDYAETVGWQ